MSEVDSGTDYALPFEKGAKSPAESHKGLLAALESEHSDETREPEDRATDEAPKAEAVEPEEDAEEEAADTEDEPDEADDAESEGDEEADADPTFEVDGETLTLQQLKDGHLRQADYTRKTQALAAERKTFEAESTARREDYTQRLAVVEQLVTNLQPAEPDWETLRKENPAEYAAQREEQRERKELLAAVQAEKQRIADEQAAAWTKAESEKLPDLIPEWRDGARATKEKEAVAQHAIEVLGWPPQMLEAAGAQIVSLLRESWLYHQGQTVAKEKLRDKKVKPATPLKPGARQAQGPSRTRRKDIEAAAKRVRKTGRLDDFAALLEQVPD